MEKTYTKDGYSFTDKNGKLVNVPLATIAKAILDHKKMLSNIQLNLEKLNFDLEQINNLQ